MRCFRPPHDFLVVDRRGGEGAAKQVVAALVGLTFGGIAVSYDDTIAPPRYVPQIPVEPSDERQGRDHINFLLMLACLYVHRFRSAVSLIRHCEPLLGPKLGQEPPEWIGIAVRDAALSVYHFGVTLRAIRAGLKRCLTLRDQVDADELRKAAKAFARDFPDAVLLRHAVGHLAEQLSTPEKMAELRRPGEFLKWETQVGGYFTMASPAGRQVRLDVHERTQAQLRRVLVMTCEAFEGADPTWIRAYG